MKKLIVISYSGDIDRVMFNAKARDNCNEPYLLLKERLRELGYTIESIGNQALQDCAKIVFWNASNITDFYGFVGKAKRLRYGFRGKGRNIIAEVQKKRLTDRLVLHLGEPPSVYCEQWNPKVYNQFPIIFTWNDNLVDGIKFHKYFPPIPVHVPFVEKMKFKHKKLLVNISMNKASTYPNELYSARLSAIRYFEKARPKNFDLFGVGWNRPPEVFKNKTLIKITSKKYEIFSSYCGEIGNKWEVLPKYKFALCYENICDQPGWITEKIFDIMRADCVPIYWGAPNIEQYIDPAAFIDRRNFKSNEELEEFIIKISEHQYNHYRDAIANYLASEKFKEFLSPAFVQRWINVLGLDISNLS
jgi:hypothetical protein